MNNGNYHYFKDDLLRRYIKKDASMRTINGSKYEILCGLLIKIFFEKLHNVDCLLGFKVKQKYLGTLPMPTDNLEDCITFFNKNIDNDSQIDFLVSPVKSFNKKLNRIDGWAFQLKRFGQFQTEKNTDGLLKFFESLKSKYQKNKANLVIFFDGHKGINLEKICKSEVLKEDFPFDSIFFIEFNHRIEDKKFVLRIGFLWPIYGYNEYDPAKAVKEGLLIKCNL